MVAVNTSIFLGLGNHGTRYDHSPHNLGFMFIDALKNHTHAKTILLEHQKVWFLPETNILLSKPLTYMNLSGRALKEIYNSFYKHKSKPDHFIRMVTVAHDDINIDMFNIKYRDGLIHPGAGGHNGIRDIIKTAQNIGCSNPAAFHRIRLGCANKSSMPLYDYVTTKMDMNKIEKWNQILEEVSANHHSDIKHK